MTPVDEPAAPAQGRHSLRLTYIIGTYPSLTTTFIDREIQALIDRGADLQVVSIRHPRSQLSPSQRVLQRRVRYLLPANPFRLAAAHLRFAVGSPSRYFGTARYLLGRPHPPGARLRTLLHFATGVYAAYLVRDRAGIHLHAHFVDRAAIVALVSARLLRSSYSVTAHANDIFIRPVMLSEKVEGATFLATCTEYNRQHLTRLLGPRLGAKIHRIYHGLDLVAYEPASRRPDGPPLVLAVGQLKEKKGLRYLVDACHELESRGIDFECRIVGDGPLWEELQTSIKQFGLTRTHLEGALQHPEVVKLYRRASVFVLPCVVADDGDRDGIPNVILEAMAMGLPVVSTPVSGIPEVVRDGATGLLVPPADAAALADAIATLIADPERGRRLGRAGHRFVDSNFEIAKNADRLLEAFGGAL